MPTEECLQLLDLISHFEIFKVVHVDVFLVYER